MFSTAQPASISFAPNGSTKNGRPEKGNTSYWDMKLADFENCRPKIRFFFIFGLPFSGLLFQVCRFPPPPPPNAQCWIWSWKSSFCFHKIKILTAQLSLLSVKLNIGSDIGSFGLKGSLAAVFLCRFQLLGYISITNIKNEQRSSVASQPCYKNMYRNRFLLSQSESAFFSIVL